METTFLQRQAEVIRGTILAYTSGRSDFDSFYDSIRSVLPFVEEYDADAVKEIKKVVFDMEETYAVRKHRGTLDEDALRIQYSDDWTRLLNLIRTRFHQAS